MARRLTRPRQSDSDKQRGVRSARGQRTIEAITRSAEELFATQGYFSTTVEDIAHRAGRSSAAVYQYFENKAAILELLAQRLIDAGESVAAALLELPESPRDRDCFTRIATGFWQNHLTYKGVTVALFQMATVDERFADMEKEIRAIRHRFLAQLVAHARAEGHATDVPRKLAPALLDAMNEHYRFVTSGHLISGDSTPQSFGGVKVLATIWYRALYAEPVAPIEHVALRRASRRKAPDPVELEGVERWAAAAHQVFEEKSFLTARVTDVAEAAHMSLGSFYTNFETKEALLLHLAAEFKETTLRGLRFDDEPGALRTSRLVGTLWRAYADNSAVMHGVFQLSMLDSDFAAEWRRTREPIIDLIAEHVKRASAERGEDDLEPVAIAEALWSMLEHSCHLWVTRREHLLVGAASEAALCRAMAQLWYRILYGVLPA